MTCNNEKSTVLSGDLYTGFLNPPSEARPFVRWWWNGNRVRPQELERELEVLKNAGFGGVEINPIAMPEEATENGDSALVWMSDEWIDRLVIACKKAKDLDMIVDLIVGTGWPFGGEFLQPSETSQRMVSHYLPYSNGTIINVNESILIQKYLEQPQNKRRGEHESNQADYQLSYVKLVPEKCSDANQIIDLRALMDGKGQIHYEIDQPGGFQLAYGLVERNFKEVYLGAPGGAGPVMDHYKKEVTNAYLSRLKKVSEKTGIPLSDLIRALFCDSIEISGANWTDDFAQIFIDTYGYSLEPWLPFVFYKPADGYLKTNYDAQFTATFKDELKRVRFDYNNLLVEIFLANFTQEFKDFCADNDLLCRYQAYGTPFLMGMLDGYQIPDIPESNNWIYSAEMKDSVWQWNQGHGYIIWNMYTAAGGHLAGRKIISTEAMTNTKGVFRTTLEEIKQHDDMNFITGMNHSVLHGYNYSPPEVEFPGWIRYGSFFSELNPWWKHINHWIDYNARLSFIFQNSQPKKSIAILGPTSDLWGEEGLGRASFHLKPQYLYKLWEPISQLGYSCEYINQTVLEEAGMDDGTISYGPMNYDLLVLASLKSVTSKATDAIHKYVTAGGKVVVIDQFPNRAPSFVDYEIQDQQVKNTLDQLLSKYPKSFLQLTHPESLKDLFGWTNNMLNQSGLIPDVIIDQPSTHVYQMHQSTAEKEIYFFANVHRDQAAIFTAQFPINGKYPWKWNPETGERSPYPFKSSQNELDITLKPLESLLLVFEVEKPTVKAIATSSKEKKAKEIAGLWQVQGNRVDGQKINWELEQLIDFSQSNDTSKTTFGGTIVYKQSINMEEGFTHIDLGNVNEGITQLYVNGHAAGTRWYGQAIYPIAEFVKQGSNEIEIHYTTVLANYCSALTDNETAQKWTRHKVVAPTGLEGPIRLLAY
ncbi:MAG: glycosyl hydrolase [Saprospiraceae bacterium]